MISCHTVLRHRQEWLWSPAKFKEQSWNMPRLMFWGTRSCTNFCAALIHYVWITRPSHIWWLVAQAEYTPVLVCAPGRVSETQGELVGTSKSQNVTAGEGRPRKVSKKARARVPLCHQLFLTDFFSAALIRPCPSEYDIEHAAKNFIPLCNHSRLLNKIKRTPTPVPNFSFYIFMINISNYKNILNRTSTYLD